MDPSTAALLIAFLQAPLLSQVLLLLLLALLIVLARSPFLHR